jgi:translation elongation factor P/translation initiation factor 5A
MKSFNEFLKEAAPPGKDAEDWIRANKQKFKDEYGEDWESVLYATAWKLFGEQIEERLWTDMIAGFLSKVTNPSAYKAALKDLKNLISIEKNSGYPVKDISFYAAKIAKRYNSVDARELADLFNKALSESEAPTNTTANVAVPDNKQFTVKRVAGIDCFDVDNDTYNRCKFGKKKYGRWDGYVEDPGLREVIKKHYGKSDKLMITNSLTGASVFLKR